jgi:siroheme synthase
MRIPDSFLITMPGIASRSAATNALGFVLTDRDSSQLGVAARSRTGTEAYDLYELSNVG